MIEKLAMALHWTMFLMLPLAGAFIYALIKAETTKSARSRRQVGYSE